MSEKNIIKAKWRPMLYWEWKTANLDVSYYPAQEKEVYWDKQSKEFNKIFWWDNFQVLSHLLKDYKWMIDLVYIDPPFDSKADYVKKIKFRWKDLQAKEQSVFEEKQYWDIWWKDEYLQFMYERLLFLRELLSDTWTIYLHCDWHKSHHLRCLMDEVFWEGNFVNEIIWKYTWGMRVETYWNRKHDNLFIYSKTNNFTFNAFDVLEKRQEEVLRRLASGVKWATMVTDRAKSDDETLSLPTDVWTDIPVINKMAKELLNYPTQKPEKLLEKIIKASSNPWDLVLDCFMWSGTTCAVAQKLGRKWIGCDINTGAIQTTTKRLNKIIEEQFENLMKESEKQDNKIVKTVIESIISKWWSANYTNDIYPYIKEKYPEIYNENTNTFVGRINATVQRYTKDMEWFNWKEIFISHWKWTWIYSLKNEIKTPLAFKIYNVNEYNIFKNKDEWIATYKTILLEAYWVETVRWYFDWKTTSSYVKVIDPNRLLSKKDIDEILKNIDDTNDLFILNKSPLKYYWVEIICSWKELDIESYIKKTNKTEVKIIVRDILIEKEWLVFKEKPSLEFSKSLVWKTLKIEIIDFISPVLLKKLEIDNKSWNDKTIIEDFKQIIDSVAIDIDFDWNLFNAEIIDNPTKKETIKWTYEWEYKKTWKQTVAIKMIDILGEELFETFEMDVK